MQVQWQMKGIYRIVNLRNNYSYIGRTTNFEKRFNEHLRLLKSNKHHNYKLQDDFNKLGEDNFYFEILEVLNNTKDSRKIEKEYIEHYSKHEVYNISDPFNEWNKSLDKIESPYDGIPLEIEGAISYEELKKIIEDQFKEGFISLREMFHESKGFRYVPCTSIEYKIRNSLSSDYNEDVRVPLVVKDILEEYSIVAIYSSKHSYIFKKHQLKFEMDCFIYVNIDFLDILYNRKSRRKTDKRKRKKKAARTYYGGLKDRLDSKNISLQTLIFDIIKEGRHTSLDDLLDKLQKLKIITDDEISIEENKKSIRRLVSRSTSYCVLKNVYLSNVLEQVGINLKGYSPDYIVIEKDIRTKLHEIHYNL